MKLYELTKQFNEVQELDPDIIGDTLEAIQLEFEDKAKNIGFIYKNMAAHMDMIEQEIKRLQGMKKTIDNRKASLIDYLRENMSECDITKIECDLFTINRLKGRDMAVVDDERSIPKDFIKVVESVDKTALLKALKEGPVDGAHIGKSKESIRIT